MLMRCTKFPTKSIINAPNSFENTYEMRSAISHNLYNKSKKNTHVRMLLLVKLQALASNVTKSNISPWVFFTFLKLYKWCKSCNTPHFPSYLWNGMLHKPFVWGHFTLNFMRIMQAVYFIFVVHKLRNCWKY